MKDALGGNGNASAYGLIYIADSVIQMERSDLKIPLRLYLTSETRKKNQTKELYYMILTDKLKSIVEQDNAKLK